MNDQPKDSPVLIELPDAASAGSPADAPPVAEPAAPPTGQAMQTMATLAARPGSALARWFWRLLLALIVFFAGLVAWDVITGLVARNPFLGYAAIALLSVFLAVCAALILKELAALSRLRRMDRFHQRAAEIQGAEDLSEARRFAEDIKRFYVGRPELWAMLPTD